MAGVVSGFTFFDWGGRPAIVQGSDARAVLAKGDAWSGGDARDGISAAIISAAGLNIGRDEFDDRFSSWGLADLDGWYRSRTSTAPYDTYVNVRRWLR